MSLEMSSLHALSRRFRRGQYKKVFSLFIVVIVAFGPVTEHLRYSSTN